mmetsp:Transcript_26859/g.79147  ORF Transcript_26859/g.79147 Transcript_26859/m.79147 type:complete len:256 (-) Transcript_26859:1075-1842(-)
MPAEVSSRSTLVGLPARERAGAPRAADPDAPYAADAVGCPASLKVDWCDDPNEDVVSGTDASGADATAKGGCAGDIRAPRVLACHARPAFRAAKSALPMAMLSCGRLPPDALSMTQRSSLLSSRRAHAATRTSKASKCSSSSSHVSIARMSFSRPTSMATNTSMMHHRRSRKTGPMRATMERHAAMWTGRTLKARHMSVFWMQHRSNHTTGSRPCKDRKTVIQRWSACHFVSGSSPQVCERKASTSPGAAGVDSS